MIQEDVARFLTNCGIHPDLTTIMIALAYFSQAVRSAALDPKFELSRAALTDDVYWIQHRLLVFPTVLANADSETSLDKACRLGALIYMKATVEEFPHSKTGSSILLEKLRGALLQVPITEPVMPLLLWLSHLGAAVSQPCPRKWFVRHLAGLVAMGGISGIASLNDRQLEMARVFSICLVLGTAVDERVWADVVMVANNEGELLDSRGRNGPAGCRKGFLYPAL